MSISYNDKVELILHIIFVNWLFHTIPNHTNEMCRSATARTTNIVCQGNLIREETLAHSSVSNHIKLASWFKLSNFMSFQTFLTEFCTIVINSKKKLKLLENQSCTISWSQIACWVSFVCYAHRHFIFIISLSMQ